MNDPRYPSTMSLSRPLTERVAAEVFEGLRMLASAMIDVWRRHRVRRDERRAFDSIARLNEHVLKDIGAPHALVARAVLRREAQHLQWVESEFR